MNKVTTDFAMGIADKDLSEELQVRSEQPWEVECKCLASHPLSWCPLAADWSLEDRGRNSPRSGAGREAGGDMGSCRTVEGNQLILHLAGEQWRLGTGREGRREARESFRTPFRSPGCGRC